MTTIYTRYTDYRRARFRIMTSIREENGRRFVTKRNAPGGDAQAHLRRIAANRKTAQALYAGIVEVCPCKMEGETLIFPYLTGITFLEEMQEAAQGNGFDGLKSLLNAYISILEGPADNRTVFVPTKDFCEVFGAHPELQGVPALAVSNLDASPGNLIRDAQGILHLIDYEWIFSFPLPRDFVIFRHLRFLYAEQGFPCFASMTLGELLTACGIRMDLDVLNRLYDDFQKYVCYEDGAAVSSQEVFEHHRRPVMEAGDGVLHHPRHYVFFDRGQGFHEQEKLTFPSEDGALHLTLDVEGVKNIRFDPFSGERTLMDNLLFTTDKGQQLAYGAEGITQAGTRTVFNAPASAVVPLPEGTKTLQIDAHTLYLSGRDDYWLPDSLRKTELEQTLAASEEQLRTEREQFRQQLEERIADHQERLQTHEDELTQTKDALRAKETQLQTALAQVKALEGVLEDTHSSRTWKMTGWLRRLGRLGKKDSQ